MAEPLIELEPELGPEIEVTARALPRVGLVAILAVTLGIILSIEAVVRGFFGTVSGALAWIPYLGSVVEEGIHVVEQKIISELAGLEQDIDAALGHNLHVAARLFDSLWHSLEYMAANIVLLGALGTAAFFNYVVHPLERWARAALAKVEAEVAHLERIWHVAEATITHTITHTVVEKIKAATVAVPRYIHRDLLALRKDVNAAKKAATSALQQVESLPFPAAATSWAAAVALALPALGLDWLNCKSNPFNRNTNACGLWNDLKNLLGLLADVALFATVCDFLLVAEPLVAFAADAVIPGFTQVTAGLCRGTIGAAKALRGPMPTPPDFYQGTPGLPG